MLAEVLAHIAKSLEAGLTMSVLARWVRPEDWTPIGVDELEANAMTVVRSTGNRSVIAGPGPARPSCWRNAPPIFCKREPRRRRSGFSPSASNAMPRRIWARACASVAIVSTRVVSIR